MQHWILVKLWVLSIRLHKWADAKLFPNVDTVYVARHVALAGGTILDYSIEEDHDEEDEFDPLADEVDE